MAGKIIVSEAAEGDVDQPVEIGTLPVGYVNARAI
jgi:hypothetical protein